jgi:hypothetical protein
LLGDVVCPLSSFQIPIAGENLTKNGVQRLLDAWWTNMPATQVELYYRNEALRRIVYRGDMQKHLGMTHEVGNSFQHTPRLQDEGRQNDATEVCARAQLRYDVRQDIALIGLHNLSIIIGVVFAFIRRGPITGRGGRPSAPRNWYGY